MTTFTDINIETLILVTVWEEPAVFQGCFRITDKHSLRKRHVFFRCENARCDKSNFLEEDFSPEDYQWTSLFEESSKAHWDPQDETKEDAFYVLKYALYTTLREMLHHRKYDFVFIDEVAMQAMFEQVKPMLQHSEVSWSQAYPDLGFAVAMDFSPSEATSERAAVVLLGKRSSLH